MRRSLLLVAAGSLLACRGHAPDAALPPARLQAVSLLGDSLFPRELPPDVAADRLARLAEAAARYDAARDDADATIWYGRRLAYLGRYREAIDVFTEGIERHPDDARLYRHRGHRFITVREFDRAIEDLARAAKLTAGRPDEVEPDGLPNARGVPTSTLQSNIWYHLGLAHYLRSDLERAYAAYLECLRHSTNPDMLVATTHWLYMTLRRLGRADSAAVVLGPITRDLDIIENHAYHRLLLMYRGEISADSVVTAAEGDALQNATVAYGVGNWHLVNGRRAEAERIFRRILDGPEWAAFGYLAAEAELARAERATSAAR